METAGLRTVDGRWVARRVYLARSFTERLRGVLKLGRLAPETALMLSPCASIHTLAVGFTIDAVFLSNQLRILRLAPRIRPWRIRFAPAGTRHVLELPEGTLDALDLDVGTFICLHTEDEHTNREHIGHGHACTEKNQHCTPIDRGPCRASHLQFSLRIPHQHRVGVEDIERCRD